VDLLPGETRTLRATWRGAPVAGRRVTLDGWNVRRRMLRADRGGGKRFDRDAAGA
jgi:hypothetical protein